MKSFFEYMDNQLVVSEDAREDFMELAQKLPDKGGKVSFVKDIYWYKCPAQELMPMKHGMTWTISDNPAEVQKRIDMDLKMLEKKKAWKDKLDQIAIQKFPKGTYTYTSRKNKTPHGMELATITLDKQIDRYTWFVLDRWVVRKLLKNGSIQFI